MINPCFAGWRLRGRGRVSALLLAMSVLVTGCDGETPIMIGAVLPLSGPGVSVGQDIRDGLDLAIERVNDRGGVNGRPLVLSVQDGAGGPQAAWDAILAGDQEPLLTVAGTSSVAVALKPLAEDRERILFGLVATAPALTEGAEWVFRYWLTAEQELPIMTSVLPDDVGGVAVYYLDDAYGQSVYGNVREVFTGTEVVVTGVPFAPADTAFGAVVEAGQGADVAVVVGFASHIRGVLAALKDSGFPGVIVSTTAAALPEVVSDPVSDDVLVAAPAIFNLSFRFADDVKRLYESLHGRPFNQYVANGYDFIIMLAGLLDGTPADRDALREQLRKGFVYSGVFGNVTLPAGAHDIAFPLFPARIRDGEIVYR
ncbi:ABC transporter substrate-binding protein [Rhodospira trueperi]|uniref:ABC-type branched-chain amino acid transport system, substrate-binding protein n=1 Tax=Rhodospira trueperi TaxID=69960 RepID=A0A1G7DZT2_9PROT|nr:ABC transporter substrate-binding protein [Rhodospira trueperi]SDE56882.1 ABC-type branched-chain amino acid transport system, substrate-binding protein [Rhodospira trueperi]